MTDKPLLPDVSMGKPIVTKGFGRRSDAAVTASPAPAWRSRASKDRRQKERRVKDSAATGYAGPERRRDRRDRRTSKVDRRLLRAQQQEAELNKAKAEIAGMTERRKNPELRRVNYAVEFSTPRLHEYQDFVHETITRTLDALKLAHLEPYEAREEIAMLVREISKHNNFAVTPAELDFLCQVAVDDMMGLGPLEALLNRPEIDEIMVNGPNCVYVEVKGVIERSSITFRNEKQLVGICQRIVGKVGRHVDESSPMCDARLPDGSRVNIILPPLALDGTILTIRRFPPEKMTLERMMSYGSLDQTMAELIQMIAACRINVLVSGGTGSGKTTMLNCLTRYINRRERIVTCEDAAELQLQQPHVLRLETRVANTEGGGQVSMRDLVRNSLRMRPDRIIVGEVRGAEAFDLLSAMSTGHDGSMGTIHANTPRDALSRLENMIAMTGLGLPIPSVRQQISSAVNVIVHVQRIRDGSRKIVSIAEVTGMEGDVITMHELVSFQPTGMDPVTGKTIGRFVATKLKPRFFDKLCEYGLEEKYLNLMEKS